MYFAKFVPFGADRNGSHGFWLAAKESKLKQNYVLYFIVRWLVFGGGASTGKFWENNELKKYNGAIWNANQAVWAYSNLAVSFVKLHKMYIALSELGPLPEGVGVVH